MSTRLRRIALTVETAARGYTWVLVESANERVFVLKKAPHACGTYLEALNGGYEELTLMAACGMCELVTNPVEREAAPLPVAELHDAI